MVFGEFGNLSGLGQILVVVGSLVMIGGAVAISLAEAAGSEQISWKLAVHRECRRYGLDPERVAATLKGEDPLACEETGRHWWELLVMAIAVAMFVWLGLYAQRPTIAMHFGWAAVLVAASLVFLLVCGVLLWKRTRFS